MRFEKNVVEMVKDDLKENYAEVFHNAFTDPIEKEVLRKILEERYKDLFSNQEKLDSIMRQVVGFDFVEDLARDKRITDIGFDGDKLIIEGNGIEKYIEPEINEEEIIQLIAKFSNSTGKELTAKDPILNTSSNHFRLNAVHTQNAVNGTTMAVRVTRPGLAITEENFENFAPLFVLDFLKAAVKARSNIFIAGDTGTGKTELQKLMISFIPFEERIALIESNKDLYAKENFPDKDIFYWVANGTATVEELIAYAGLRSHPVWIMVGEVLGREVYQMTQGILTGHKFTTTLHATDARAIPRRLLGMAKMGYNIDENMFLDDIYRYVDFGIHTEKIDGIRYLSEIVEYHHDHTATTVFKQVKNKNGFERTTGKLSSKFYERAMKYDSDFKGFADHER
ncbi:MAG: ATPase, T2SS/T4P/T4SS family [Bacillota bacterium]|uniref:CpaF/VirB11 family protein n=1 Tax=Virgibacillus sp. Bac332 TaxID=2419842 RepID=UPI000EF4A1BF|nr:CpaF/VirB11 family protein [Virgibacillus sp. Bac332]